MIRPAFYSSEMINYNMRCIETLPFYLIKINVSMINYNMRCIETRTAKPQRRFGEDKLQHEMY